MKIRKLMDTLEKAADKSAGGHLRIWKAPEGWNVSFSAPRALQADLGDPPLKTFEAAAKRALDRLPKETR